MDGVGDLIDDHLALVEVGPGQALASLARQHAKRSARQLIVTSLHPAQDFSADFEYLLAAAGQLWTRGIAPDWPRLHEGVQRRRVAAPTYPFARHRRWVDPSSSAVTAHVAAATNAGTVARPAASAAKSPQSAGIKMTEDRSAKLIVRLQALFAKLSGIEPAALAPTAGFLELGLDSLFLTQASNAIQKEFGAKIPIRALLEDCSTLATLAARLNTLLPDDSTSGRRRRRRRPLR